LFQSFIESASRQQDAPLAALADQAHVYADTNDGPFVAAAGMFFAQAHHIAQVNFYVSGHSGWDYNIVGRIRGWGLGIELWLTAVTSVSTADGEISGFGRFLLLKLVYNPRQIRQKIRVLFSEESVMLTRLIYTLMVLWLTAVACATPTTPEAIIETAVPPTHTPQPTATTAPTATPEPTATPTAEEQANQLLLADGRFTTLLAELTQEIGRGLSDAEREQAMALARALWLPGQLDESDWLPDPAGVTLHWWPALDGREGPVFLVGEEAQADSPYAAGAVIFWQGERLLGLTPGGVGYYFEFGRIQQNGWDFDTWVEYDAEGNIVSFVHPETMQYVTRESEDWSICRVGGRRVAGCL
jgi:hypothetical protein